jgi:Tfp pilus assembly protein PilF
MKRFGAILILTVCGMPLPLCPAQGGGQAAGGKTSSTPSTRSQPVEMARELFLSGRVMMEDGSPPPEPVAVEVVCASNRIPQSYTDSKGKFSFRLGEHQEVMAEASMGGGGDQDVFGNTPGGRQQRISSPAGATAMSAANNSLMGCDLHVTLAGYRADDVSLSQKRSMDNPDVGTIILHRLVNVKGSAISVTSLEVPNEAKNAYDKGIESLRKHNSGEARKQLEKAVEVYPKYAAAWFNLGIAYVQQKKIDDAKAAFSKAIDADPAFVRPYLAAAQLAFQQKKWSDVVDLTDRLNKLDPVDFPQSYLMNAMAYGGLSNFTAAEQSAREAVKLDTAHKYPRSEYILGFILANKQDYAGALKYMRSYVEHAPNAPDVESVKRDIAQMEQATGQAKATP